MIIKIFYEEINHFLIFFSDFFPGRIGVYLRRLLYKNKMKSFGKNVFLDKGLYIPHAKTVSIGNNCRINRFGALVSCEKSSIKIGSNVSMNEFVNVNAANGGHINIGDNTLIASNVVIRAADHETSKNENNIKQNGHIPGNIIIGKNVWISSNCVILKDVKIGDNAVIGAGTVIREDVEKNRTVVGSAQRVIN
jgi:acetyltransferase-like isoleucine patch superfamily enzyme